MRRAVLVADAGLGKTTLLLGEAQHCAQEALALIDAESDGEVATVEIPVYLRLADLAEALATEQDVFAAITECGVVAADLAPDSGVISWLAGHLRHGPAALLLDGLDELPSGSRGEARSPRDRVEAALAQLVGLEDIERLRVVVASRVQGYRPPWPLRPSAEEGELEILPMAEPEVSRTLASWLTPDRQLGAAATAYLDGKPALRSLGRNPLLLSFVYMLIRAAGAEGLDRLPRTRAELYEGMVFELVRAQWRTSERGRTDSPGSAEAKLRALETAALDLATDGQGWLASFSSDRLFDALPGDGPRAGSDLMDELVLRTGFLVQLRKPLWGEAVPYTFLHRSLHEYLVARALSHRPIREIIEAVAQRLWFRPEWDQVLLFLAARLPDPNPLLRRLVAEPHDALYQMTVLAGRCIAEADEQQVDRRIVEEVAGRCIRSLASRSYFNRRRAAEVAAALPTTRVVRAGLRRQRYLRDSSDGWYRFFASLRVPGTLPELLQATASPNGNVRAAAATGLGAVADEAGRVPLVQLLWDSDPMVAAAAATGLGRLRDPSAFEELLRVATDEAWRERYAAATAVRGGSLNRAAWEVALAAATSAGQFADEQQAPALAKLAESESEDLRELAAVAYGAASGSWAVSGLLRVLQDPTRRVSRRALVELAHRELDEDVRADVVATFGDLSRSQTGVRRLEALTALTTISGAVPPELLAALEIRADEPPRDILEALTDSLDRYGDESSLVALSDSPATWVRSMAVGLLGGRGQEGIQRLAGILRSPDEEYWVTRLAAARALANSRGAEPQRALGYALQADPDRSVRAGAAESLGRLGNLAAVPLLAGVLQTEREDDRVRSATATALGILGGDSAMEALAVQAVHHHELSDFRGDVLAARLQRGDMEAFQKLIELTASTELGVATQAYASLIRFTPTLVDRADWPQRREELWEATEHFQYSPGWAARTLAGMVVRGLQGGAVEAARGAADRLRRKARPTGQSVESAVTAATPLSEGEPPDDGGETLIRYVTGRTAGDWMWTMNRIEGRKETAVVRRLQERDWEAWMEGRLVGSFTDEETALAIVAQRQDRDGG